MLSRVVCIVLLTVFRVHVVSVQSSVGARIRFERTAVKTLAKKEMLARQGGRCAECGADLKPGVAESLCTLYPSLYPSL